MVVVTTRMTRWGMRGIRAIPLRLWPDAFGAPMPSGRLRLLRPRLVVEPHRCKYLSIVGFYGIVREQVIKKQEKPGEDWHDGIFDRKSTLEGEKVSGKGQKDEKNQTNLHQESFRHLRP